MMFTHQTGEKHGWLHKIVSQNTPTFFSIAISGNAIYVLVERVLGYVWRTEAAGLQ